MNWKKFLVGGGVGVIGGYYGSEGLKKNCLGCGEKVVERVKEGLKDCGRIEGWWIKFRGEEYEKYGIKREV